MNGINRDKIFHSILLLFGAGCIPYAVFLSIDLCSTFIIGRDEANFILKSTIQLTQASDIKEYVNGLFVTHGQHVLLGMQLGNLFSYYILGHIDFKFINIIGLLYIIVPAFVILKRAELPLNNKLKAVATGCILIFPLALSPSHISCAINTACTGNHYLGLGASILALHFFIPSAHDRSRMALRMLLAETFTFLAVLSSPAALVLIPLSIVLLCTNDRQHKILWLGHLLFVTLLLLLYVYIIDPQLINASLENNHQEPLKSLALYLLFIFNLLGSFFFWPDTPLTTGLTILIGLSIMLCALYCQFHGKAGLMSKDPNTRFLAAGFVLLLAMIMLIAFGRYREFGSPRYAVYGCFALIFVLLLLARQKTAPLNHPLKFWLIAICCLLYYPFQLSQQQPYIERIRQEIVRCEKRWYEQGLACGVMIKHQEATDLLLDAARSGVLELPLRRGPQVPRDL